MRTVVPLSPELAVYLTQERYRATKTYMMFHKLILDDDEDVSGSTVRTCRMTPTRYRKILDDHYEIKSAQTLLEMQDESL